MSCYNFGLILLIFSLKLSTNEKSLDSDYLLLFVFNNLFIIYKII